MKTFVIVAESLAAEAELDAYGVGKYEGEKLLAKGDAWDCFVAVLGELTLEQLDSHGFDENVCQAKIAAGRRETKAPQIAEWGAADEPLPIETTGRYVPPEAGAAPAETDEDGDPTEEPTPLEVTDPAPEKAD